MVAKPLSENDNAKQQIYLGGSFQSLNAIPYGDVTQDSTPKTPNLKAALSMYWIAEDGSTVPAPHAKLILYPKYPEIRLSGFIRGCSAAPSELLQPIPRARRKFDNAPDGRVLILGISSAGKIFAYLAPAGSTAASECIARSESRYFEHVGVFWEQRLDVADSLNARAELLRRLATIYRGGWHRSRRLRDGIAIDYDAQNGGGYTLEALFGISPNGDSAPDFMGWEIKACGSDRVTLMTPEPNGGYYGKEGAEAFLRKYGRHRVPDTYYFTGIHRVAEACPGTGQMLVLRGFVAGGNTFEANGHVELVDDAGSVSASWSFAKLLQHWGRKHALAVYVPCDSRPGPPREYLYGSPVHLGEGTDFIMFLTALSRKVIFYDPAPKVTVSNDGRSKVHARSQFRIRVNQLNHLYQSYSAISL